LCYDIFILKDYIMKEVVRLTESELNRIVKRILTEEVSASVADTMWNAHPGSEQGTIFFPKIIPNQYKATGSGTGKWWVNSCATKMSMALAKLGHNVPGDYRTEIAYNGIPAGTTFNPSSRSMLKILTNTFGTPTLTLPLNGSGVPQELIGRKGFYALVTSDWEPGAGGHTDVWNGQKSKNGDHWDVTGTVYFWGPRTELQINTENCGWGNDTEGYKKSGWRCHDDPKKDSPAKNAKKCGWGNNVKGYRQSGWKCPK
jgi:hypothetical protein